MSTPTLPATTDLPPVRQTAIDYMKAFLVIGMILGHALQLLSIPRGLLWGFSMTINLITFSGFFFCFGYVFRLVYFARPLRQVRGKMARTAWKTLVGYYISAFASALLLSQHITGIPFKMSVGNVFDILRLANIPWYSEFLLAFFLITLLALLIFEPIRGLLARPVLMLATGLVCLLTAVLLPYDLRLPNALGLLIGTRTYSLFPIVQYLPIFLAGLYFARHRIVWNPVVAGLGLAGTSSFVAYYVINRDMPQEFLPSIYWLIGSYGILYGYFLLANWLERSKIHLPALLSIGRNTLLYLILSNVFLFALSDNLTLQPVAALGTGVSMLLLIGFLLSLVTPAAGTGQLNPGVSAARQRI